MSNHLEHSCNLILKNPVQCPGIHPEYPSNQTITYSKPLNTPGQLTNTSGNPPTTQQLTRNWCWTVIKYFLFLFSSIFIWVFYFENFYCTTFQSITYFFTTFIRNLLFLIIFTRFFSINLFTHCTERFICNCTERIAAVLKSTTHWFKWSHDWWSEK